MFGIVQRSSLRVRGELTSRQRADQARERLHELAGRLEPKDLLHEHPLASLGVVLGAGIILGYSPTAARTVSQAAVKIISALLAQR